MTIIIKGKNADELYKDGKIDSFIEVGKELGVI